MLVIKNENVLIYAFENHISVNHLTVDEFLNDYKIFKTVKRHIKKYEVLESKLPILLNNIIILNNIFTFEVVKNILNVMLDEYTNELNYIYYCIDNYQEHQYNTQEY